MTCGFFSKANNSKKGFFHRIDPRAKMISFSLLIAAIVITPSYAHYKFAVYFLMLIFMIYLSHIPLRDVSVRLLFLFSLLVFIAVSLFIFEKNPFSENLVILWNIFVKAVLALLCLSVLSATTEFYHLIMGLESLKIPRVVTALFSFAYRYSFLFIREAGRMRNAVYSRSYRKGTLLQKIKMLTYMVPHLFFKTFERSERIYAAMLSRGYTGRIQIFSFLKLGREDFLFIFPFHFLLALTVIFL